MTRALFLIFICLILILSVFLGYSTYNVHYLVKRNEKVEKVLDSVREDNNLLKMNLDKQIFIIDQIHEIYPKQVDNILNDTE
jgi:hypothetical protein